MTAFDRVWDLAKMPLVRDSIEYGEPDWTGFPTATALFQHPTNPDVQYRMSAWEDHGGTRMAVDDETGEEGRRAGWAYFRTPHPNSLPHTTTSDINTKPDYRRLGIATAMYDLINEMAQKHHRQGRVVSSPANLSSENARLWNKALRRSRGFGVDSMNSGEQIMWPEKGVYE
jgi:GNAT superfamily N-acetyltransferase